MPNRHYIRSLYIFSFLSIFSYAWIFSITPMMGEDLAFLNGWNKSYDPSLFEWLFQRSKEQINGWNARLGEQLAIFWVNMPGWLFASAAVFSLIALAILTSYIYSGSHEILLKVLIFLGVIFWLWPGLEVFFWKTANAAYLQPLLLNLLCIAVYRNAETIGYWTKSKTAVIAITLAAVLAGLSFENVPVAVAIYMLTVLVMAASWKRLWPALFPVLGILLGWAVLMMAPSTAIRRETYRQIFGVEHADFAYYIQRGFEVSERFLHTSSMLFIISLASVGYLAFLHAKGYRSYSLSTFVTIVPAVLVVGSLVMAPYTEPRAFSLAWVLMLAAVVEAANQLSKRFIWARWAIITCMLVSAVVSIKSAFIYSDVADFFNKRENRIVDALQQGECSEGVSVSLAEFDYKYKFFNNRDDWYITNLAGISDHYNCRLINE